MNHNDYHVIKKEKQVAAWHRTWPLRYPACVSDVICVCVSVCVGRGGGYQCLNQYLLNEGFEYRFPVATDALFHPFFFNFIFVEEITVKPVSCLSCEGAQ